LLAQLCPATNALAKQLVLTPPLCCDGQTDIIPVEPEEGEGGAAAGGGGRDGPAAGGRGSARQAAAVAAAGGGGGGYHHQPGIVPGGGGEAHTQLFSQWSAEGQAQQHARGRR
jgi:hypothetical protein